MTVLETLQMVGDRLQVALVICGFPDEDGEVSVLHANIPAAYIFGFQQTRDMVGLDIKSFMPEHIAEQHADYVKAYIARYAQTGGHVVNQSGIMGSWRALSAKRCDGSTVHIHANVADIKNSEERYLVAVFRDRSDDIDREVQMEHLVEELAKAKELAEQSREEAVALKDKAEEALLKERKLTAQVTLLRQIFTGTVGLVGMLGVLIVASWVTGNKESKDALAMIERVLLVMTGILGSAMASVFDSRGKSAD